MFVCMYVRACMRVCVCVCVCVFVLSTFSNIFFSKTTGLIEARFHVESPWDWGTNICSNSHVTWPRWPPASYMVKTLKHLLHWNQRPTTLKLGRQHWVHKYYQVYSMMTLGWPWLILRQGEIWSLILLYGKKGKIVVYDVKVGICSLLYDYMKLYEYQRSRLFIDLCLRSFRDNIFKLLSSR